MNIILPNIISLEKVNLPIFFRNLPDLLNYVVCIAKGGLVSEGIFTVCCSVSMSYNSTMVVLLYDGMKSRSPERKACTLGTRSLALNCYFDEVHSVAVNSNLFCCLILSF